jgi:hypothetical protein
MIASSKQVRKKLVHMFPVALAFFCFSFVQGHVVTNKFVASIV